MSVAEETGLSLVFSETPVIMAYKIVNSLKAGKLFMLSLASADFFQNLLIYFFFISVSLSEC